MNKEKLQEDIKTAMKNRDQLVLNTLRGFMSEIKRYEIDTREVVDADRFVTILQKEVKKRRDALDFAKTAGRSDLVEQNEVELKILQGYLGEQLSEEKLSELISGLASSGMKNIGQIMGELNKNHKGQFDGKLASELAKKLLTPQ